MDNDRLLFDVANALAILSRNREPFSFPKNLSLTDEARRVIEDVIDAGSVTSHSCKIRSDFGNTNRYELVIGNDTLNLFRGGQIRLGGSGVTIPLFDEKLRRNFALKAPRVSVLAYKALEFNELDEKNFEGRVENEYVSFENERQISRRLSHVNIAQHFYGDKKEFQLPGSAARRASFPYSVSEWIDGARSLHDYLKEETPSIGDVIDLMLQTFSALEHIHLQDVLHWDLKSDNILISKNGIAKVIDFGNSKLLDVDREGDLTATTTKGKYPDIKIFQTVNTGEDESRRFRISLPNRSWNHRFIDLWMLTQEWNRCLRLLPTFIQGKCDLTDPEQTAIERRFRNESRGRSEEAWECLRIIFDRVLFPFSKSYENTMTKENNSFNESALYFKSSTEIMSEMSRIVPPFGAAQNVTELLVSLDDVVRLPVTGNSVFTERVAAIVDTDVVRPTTLHYQLAQVRQVFPGATHTRFEHLLGTLSTATYFIRSLYLNDGNAFWRVSVEASHVRAVLLAAILHDAGHLAFGHFIEEMDDLLEDRKHSDFTIFLLEACLNHSDLADETTRARATRGVRREPKFSLTDTEITQLISVIRRSWCSENGAREGTNSEVRETLEAVISIFRSTRSKIPGSAYLSREGTGRALNSILRSIIDGPIDADKLDYLRRDSLHSGVFFANSIDLERFFESLRCCVLTADIDASLQPGVGVSEKGVAPGATGSKARRFSCGRARTRAGKNTARTYGRFAGKPEGLFSNGL
jgi:serine/threonine protein kinase